MLKDIVQVRPLGDDRLNIRFEEGVEGEIDVEKITNFSEIFAPLKDENIFGQVLKVVEMQSEAGAGPI